MYSQFVGMSFLCMFVVLNGCGSSADTKTELAKPPFPKDKYAGNFSSINRSDRMIRMLETTGFGFASPEAGNLIPNAEAGLHFPPLDSFPNETTIRWRDDSDGNEYEQTVQLADVVPKGVDGTTALEFTADRKWTVRFVPGSEDSAPE